MTLYIVRDDTVTAYASAPARASEDELRVGSAKEIETSGLSNAQMAAIWNALPGTTAVAKFKDRKTAVQRFWAAFSQLPVALAPAGGSAGRLEAGPGHRAAATAGRGDHRPDGQCNGLAAPHGARPDLRKRLIRSGLPTEALVAYVLVSKYALASAALPASPDPAGGHAARYGAPRARAAPCLLHCCSNRDPRSIPI
jgi:hypothetical protein